MKITTVTLNPAFDLHCYAEEFKPYHENIFSITAQDAGGKGINVSRALNKNGVKHTAIAVVGKENGAEFINSLAREGLSVSAVYAEGRIRENITLHEAKSPETRISFAGFSMGEDTLAEVRRAIGAVDAESVIVFAGSAPKGLEEATLVSFLEELKREGARLVIDSRTISAASLEKIRPMLIKPNKEEAEKALGIRIENLSDASAAAKALVEKGIEYVLLSLGAEGAILASGNGVWYANAPHIKPISTVGAGDSTLAGFLVSYLSAEAPEKCLARAVAFGSAACLLEGTQPPCSDAIADLFAKISVKRL